MFNHYNNVFITANVAITSVLGSAAVMSISILGIIDSISNIALTSIMAVTAITAIEVIKGIITITSNKAIHIDVEAIMDIKPYLTISGIYTIAFM